MEKENKFKGMNLFIIGVLIVTIIILVAYIVITSSNDKKVANFTEQPVKSEIAQQNQSETKTTNIESKPDVTNQLKTNREMTADERYKLYTDGLKNSLKTISKYGEVFDEGKFESHFFYSEDFLREAGINNVSLRNNGEVYAELSKDSYLAKKYGTNYKIASNIVQVGTTFAGQEGGIIYMINETGKFYYCRIYGVPADSQTHSLEFKEITTLKNIVNVELLNDGEAMIPFAVDINGNIFSLDVN